MTSSGKKFGGVITALATPFLKGEVDFNSIKKLLRHQLDNGIDGFVVSGSTGEAATLTLTEKIKILEFVRSEVSASVPVIVGSGTFNTQETCELVKVFEKSNPDAYLLVTPYYNKPPQRGLEKHFLQIAKQSTRPMILYNVPGRTACTLNVETTASIARQASNIVGIKEAAGDLEIIRQLKENCPKDFQIISGDDPTFLEAIALGAGGVISVVSHVIPKLCSSFAQEVLKTPAQAKIRASEILDISNGIFCESNPIPLKWALKEMGIFASSELRLPLVELDAKYHDSLRQSLKNIGAL
jgi:4-hydroxy-tetrahydrodipicolinate synthase